MVLVKEMHQAIKNSDAAALKALLDRGANPNGTTGPLSYLDHGPLIQAVQADALDCIKVLLCAGANPNFYAGDRANPSSLYYAKSTQAAKLLLDHGADIEARFGPSGFTPLLWHAYLGNDALVPFLLSRGADAKAVDQVVGFGLLQTIAYGGSICLLRQFLWLTGVDVVDGLGRSLLAITLIDGNDDAAMYLLEQGASIDVPSNMMPLLVEAARHKSKKAFYKILDHPNTTQEHLDRALYFAASRLGYAATKALLDRGAKVDSEYTASTKKMLLDEPVRRGDATLTSLLVQAGARGNRDALLREAEVMLFDDVAKIIRDSHL